MAWWSKSVQDPAPAPATIERIKAALDVFDYGYDDLPDGRGISAGFNGVGMLFLLEAGGDFVEVSAGWVSELPEDRLPEAAEWCNMYNRSAPFPRMHASMSPDGITVYGESYFWAGNGLTEEQLANALAAGIATGVRSITDVREALGDPIPANLQGDA